MKKFFNRIWMFLKVLFLNPEKWIDENVKPAIELVQNIKTLIDSPIAIAITAIIPGQWDDNLRKLFSAHLHVVLDLFVAIDGEDILAAQEPLEVKLNRFVAWLKAQTPTVRAAVYAKLSSRLAIESAGVDEVVKNHAVDLITQATYSKIKAKIHEDDLPAVDASDFIELYK